MPSLNSETPSSRDSFLSVAVLEKLVLDECYSYEEMDSAKNSVLRELGSGFRTPPPPPPARLLMTLLPSQHLGLSLKRGLTPHSQTLGDNKSALFGAVKLVLIC